MNTFTTLLLCVQACLVQNVFSQCIQEFRGIGAVTNACSGHGTRLTSIAPAPVPSRRGCGDASVASVGGVGLLTNAGALRHGVSSAAAYGGIGEGNLAVIGELPVVGNTAVIGQVPIVGAVRFGGDVPASGCVSINGKCACACECGY